LQAWEAELREAMALAGGHLSLYQLTIEPNTSLTRGISAARRSPRPTTIAVAMFELTQTVLRAACPPTKFPTTRGAAGKPP